MGKLFNIRSGKDKVWNLEGYIFETFIIFTTWKLSGGLAVSVQWTVYHVRIEMRQSLLSFNMCWHFQKYPCTSDRERNRTFSQM